MTMGDDLWSGDKSTLRPPPYGGGGDCTLDSDNKLSGRRRDPCLLIGEVYMSTFS